MVRLPLSQDDSSQTTNQFTELSIAPHLNQQLVPPHMRPVLAAKGLDIDNLQPLSKDQMIARLD